MTEVFVHRSRPIECPAHQPRLLHQITPSTSLISSISIDENHNYILTPEVSVSPINQLVNEPFRCHDCPQPQDLGCIASEFTYEQAAIHQASLPPRPDFQPEIIQETKQSITVLTHEPEKASITETILTNTIKPEVHISLTHEEFLTQLKEYQAECEKEDIPPVEIDPEWLKSLHLRLV